MSNAKQPVEVNNTRKSKVNKTITIRLSEDVIEYFKHMADEVGVPYQRLIHLYLRDCVTANKKIDISWVS